MEDTNYTLQYENYIKNIKSQIKDVIHDCIGKEIIKPIEETKELAKPIEEVRPTEEVKIKNWTGVPIKSFQLRSLDTKEWGEEYSCHYFNEILPKLCKVLIDRHTDFDVEKLNNHLGKTCFFYGDGKGTNSKQIEGTNIFVETNFDNNGKVELCYSIIKLFGYSKNDLKINIYKNL